MLQLNFEKLPYQAQEIRGEASSEGKQFFDSGMKQYIIGDYEGAVKKLKKAANLAPDNERYWLYLGVTYYLSRQPKLAVEALTRADTLAPSILKTKTGWYRAQAYLLAGDSSHAAPLLDRVKRENRDYASKADSLLISIRSGAASKSGG